MNRDAVGLYRALVTDSRDPENLGRVKVSIPAVTGDRPSEWIYPVVNSGYVVKPTAGDQVWVMFEAGDAENPVWLGKTKVTKTGITKQNKGYATLLDRLEQAEDDIDLLQSQVATLQAQVAALQSGLASHSH